MKFTLIFVCLTALLEGKAADLQTSNTSISQDSEIPPTAAGSFTTNEDDSSDVPAKITGSRSATEDDNLTSPDDSAKPSSAIKDEVPSTSTEDSSSSQDDDDAASFPDTDSPIEIEADATSDPSATPIVNSNAICGRDAGGKTCEGNPYGPCCSDYGFCGSSPFFCHSSAKCQSGCKDEELSYSVTQECGKRNNDLPCAPNGPFGSCCNEYGYCGDGEDYCKAEQPTLQQ